MSESKEKGSAEDRYFVDERIGCIGVWDRHNMDKGYPGLHPDSRGVVGYWQGKYIIEPCRECGHHLFKGWQMSEEIIEAAKTLCERLNSEWKETTKHCPTPEG